MFENISTVSAGAAFILSGNTKLVISKNSQTLFRNNHVTQHGATIYIITAPEVTDTSFRIHDMISQLAGVIITSLTKCFVNVEGTRSNTTRLTFINNTAEKGGDVLYGGMVATGYDGDWNCLLSFKNISDLTRQSSGQPFRQITSEPSRVCLCTGNQGPDCLVVIDPTHHTLYPGETLSVFAAVVGQDFGTVSGNIYAQLLSPDSFIQSDQHWVPYNNSGCIELPSVPLS